MSMDIAAAMEYNRLVLKDSISTTITQKRLKILRDHILMYYRRFRSRKNIYDNDGFFETRRVKMSYIIRREWTGSIYVYEDVRG